MQPRSVVRAEARLSESRATSRGVGGGGLDQNKRTAAWNIFGHCRARSYLETVFGSVGRFSLCCCCCLSCCCCYCQSYCYWCCCCWLLWLPMQLMFVLIIIFLKLHVPLVGANVLMLCCPTCCSHYCNC